MEARDDSFHGLCRKPASCKLSVAYSGSQLHGSLQRLIQEAWLASWKLAQFFSGRQHHGSFQWLITEGSFMEAFCHRWFKHPALWKLPLNDLFTKPASYGSIQWLIQEASFTEAFNGLFRKSASWKILVNGLCRKPASGKLATAYSGRQLHRSFHRLIKEASCQLHGSFQWLITEASYMEAFYHDLFKQPAS